MPRDINGDYTLPAGNPVVPGTTIATTWANTTLSDIAAALTASLSVDGSVTTAKLAASAVTPPKLAGATTNGFISRISAATFAPRTLTGTANQIAITNGNGFGGDPVFSIPAFVNLDAVTANGITTGGLAPVSSGTTDLGNGSSRWDEAYVQGVNFPATQVPSADPNVLDDYEEGTFTPTFTFSTAGNLSVTYTNRIGTYTKIGRTVTYQIVVSLGTMSYTTSVGDIRITGLPFTNPTAAGFVLAMGAVQGITTGTAGYLVAIQQSGVTYAILSANFTNTASNSTMQTANAPSGATPSFAACGALAHV